MSLFDALLETIYHLPDSLAETDDIWTHWRRWQISSCQYLNTDTVWFAKSLKALLATRWLTRSNSIATTTHHLISFPPNGGRTISLRCSTLSDRYCLFNNAKCFNRPTAKGGTRLPVSFCLLNSPTGIEFIFLHPHTHTHTHTEPINHLPVYVYVNYYVQNRGRQRGGRHVRIGETVDMHARHLLPAARRIYRVIYLCIIITATSNDAG